MANLRIIAVNAADAATITADSTAGALGVANLKTERKGEMHRSTATSVSYVLTWPAGQALSGVVIPACNLTPAATIQVQGWDAETAGTLLFDTGAVPACAGQNVGAADFGVAVTASLFSWGAASKAVCWFAEQAGVRRLQIDLVDGGNPAGFIDCARLVVGRYWSPSRNASYGARFGLDDASEVKRTDAGGLSVDRLPFKESLTCSLDDMTAADRDALNRITKLAGGFRPILFSLVPDSADAQLVQEALIYGVRKLSPVGMLIPGVWQNSLSIEGW